MKLEFILEEEDFLNYHLFSISENKNAKKIEGVGKYILAAFFLYFGVNLYNSDNIELAILFGILAILSLLFLTKLYKNQILKSQRKIIRQTYKQRIGEKEHMEFTSDYLLTEDKSGYGKTKISQIECVNEIPNNFFIKLSNGSSFIISKNGLENLDGVRRKWEELSIPINEYMSWKWN